ncbi:MAG: FAD-dependent oxidoreductase, partial [Planctomycetota bacterium]
MIEGGSSSAEFVGEKQVVDVAIIGGGLAGIAAALRLAKSGLSVQLIEAKSRLGGRTGSFSSSGSGGSGKTIDYCQHVAMKCNTAMLELIAELGQDEDWRPQETLHFYGPDGKYSPLSQLPLPAPLHIGHWLWRWPGLSLRDRLAIARGMLKIYRLNLSSANLDQISGYDWLKQVGQTQNAIERFWATIIVSALGEECHRVSLAAVAKVLQDGFMKRRDAFHLLVPERPLDKLLNVQARDKLVNLGVDCHMSSPVSCVARSGDGFVVAAKG